MTAGSSAISALRALVIFACLLGVPAIAVFGTLSPKGMVSVVEARWTARMASGEEVAENRANAGSGESPDRSPLGSSRESADSSGSASLTRTEGPREDGPPDYVASGRPGFQSGQQPASGMVTASGDANQLMRMQQRFRGLGATYCRLETWGDRGELYRFHCRVGIGGSSGFSRHYEATDADPLQAMAKVLAEVEASSARR